MALKWKELESVLSEARTLLEGAVLQKIAQTGEIADGEAFGFSGFSDEAGPWRLFVSLFKDHTCACLLPEDLKADSAAEPETFVMLLRKHLLGRHIQSVEQVVNERIFLLHFETGISLLVELIPKHGNILLLKSWSSEERSGKTLGSFRKVSLEAGALYHLPPPPQQAQGQREEFASGTGPLAYNAGVARHYWALLAASEFQSLKRDWRQAVKGVLKKMRTACDNANSDLDQAKEAELYQQRGKTLVAHLYELGPKSLPKAKSVELDGLTIPLDRGKSFSDNAELFFKKAKKFTRAVSELAERLEGLGKKVNDLEQLAEEVERAESGKELLQLSENFKRLGVPIPEEKEETEEDRHGKPFVEVMSTDGFTIFCGRNQEENRRVTFQEAKGNDLWLHVKGIPGAHVVVKSRRDKSVPLNTLLEAAQLALYHSKIRKGKRAEVDYTQRKYVRAIKGTFAEVTYTGNKTLYVEADPEVLKKIMRA